MKCEKDEAISFHKLNCLLSECENKCEVLDIMEHLKNIGKRNENSLILYYVFEIVPTKYYNNNGELTYYNRTTRLDKKSTFHEIISQLQSLAQHYLVHRFSVANDQFYWQKFLQNSTYFMWLDYSNTLL